MHLVHEYLDLAEQYPPRTDKVIKKHVMSLLFGGFIHNKPLIQDVFEPKDIAGVRAAVEKVKDTVLAAHAARQSGATTTTTTITTAAAATTTHTTTFAATAIAEAPAGLESITAGAAEAGAGEEAAPAAPAAGAVAGAAEAGSGAAGAAEAGAGSGAGSGAAGAAGGGAEAASDEERARQANHDRYAYLPNGEGRWYWRYRLRPDAGKRESHSLRVPGAGGESDGEADESDQQHQQHQQQVGNHSHNKPAGRAKGKSNKQRRWEARHPEEAALRETARAQGPGQQQQQ